jgi:transposase
MVEGAWAVSRTACRPGAGFGGRPRRFGRLNIKKAAVAVAHTLLCVAWAVMKDDSDYAEAGADYYDLRDQRNHEHLVRHHQQALARLGYQVALIPPGDGKPPPGLDSDSPQHPAA